MKEHLIPQDITGYRFHIIGSMTLGQFAQILLGVALAFIFYKTNLPNFIKYPISGVFFVIGLAAAFVPIEERPLSDWIVNFAKALYKPTKFHWQKTPKIPYAFEYEADREIDSEAVVIDVSPIRKEKIKQFLQSVNQNQDNYDEFDLAEDQRVGQIIHTFQQTQVVSQPTQQLTKPDLKIRRRKIAPPPQSFAVYQQDDSQAGEALQNQRNDSPPITIASDQNPGNQADTQQQSSQAVNNEEESVPIVNAPEIKQAVQRQDLPFPNKPTQPNKIVGMILSSENELIGDALIELKNDKMQTITAVKSNALGQFQISQTLNNGKYIIDASEQGFQFSPQQIELRGGIIDPVEIVAN